MQYVALVDYELEIVPEKVTSMLLSNIKNDTCTLHVYVSRVIYINHADLHLTKLNEFVEKFKADNPMVNLELFIDFECPASEMEMNVLKTLIVTHSITEHFCRLWFTCVLSSLTGNIDQSIHIYDKKQEERRVRLFTRRLFENIEEESLIDESYNNSPVSVDTDNHSTTPCFVIEHMHLDADLSYLDLLAIDN